jgi:hypothetical protein
MEELFRDYWWLIFPIFGMFMATRGMWHSEKKTGDLVALIKTYTDHGKEPPPELLRLAAARLQSDDGDDAPATPQSRRRGWAWTFFLFAGLAAGFATGYALASPTEDWAWVFLAVAVAMAVMAVGALVMLVFGEKR